MTAKDWSSISHESTQVINCNYLVKLTMILFLTSINYKDCKLQTLTTSRGWSVLFLTSLLMITSGNYFRISEKHLSAVNIEQRTKFLLQLALKVRDFLTNNKNCCYFPAFPMLQPLKIVFTFCYGKKLRRITIPYPTTTDHKSYNHITFIQVVIEMSWMNGWKNIRFLWLVVAWYWLAWNWWTRYWWTG